MTELVKLCVERETGGVLRYLLREEYVNVKPLGVSRPVENTSVSAVRARLSTSVRAMERAGYAFTDDPPGGKLQVQFFEFV